MDRQLYTNYKKLQEKVKKESRKAQREYHSKLLDGNTRDPKKYWRNRACGKQKLDPVLEIKIDGEI